MGIRGGGGAKSSTSTPKHTHNNKQQGAEAEVRFFSSTSPDNYGKKGMQCKVVGKPFAKALPPNSVSSTFSVGFLRDHKRAWGGSWVLGVSSTAAPIVASPAAKTTPFSVSGVSIQFTNHCGGGYSCAHSQPSCNMLPVGVHLDLKSAIEANAKPKAAVSF